MRFVISESFDNDEVNHFFDADIPFTIGEILRTRAGRAYRVKDVAWQTDSWDEDRDVRVLLKRVR